MAGLGAMLLQGTEGAMGQTPAKGEKYWGGTGEARVSTGLCTELRKLKLEWAICCSMMGRGKGARRHHVTEQGRGLYPSY